MKLKEHQIEALWLIYSEFYSVELDFFANQKVFISALELIENCYEDDLNLAALSTDAEEYAREKELFLAILGALEINEDEQKLIFNPTYATALYVQSQQKPAATSLRAIHAQYSNLGIQEKFLKGWPVDREWATDLDLRRLLLLTGTQDKIKITRFNATDLGMAFHFAREDRGDAQGSYQIGFLVNKGSVGFAQGSHWFALTLMVDPVAHKISYRVQDSMPLSETAREELHRTITTAIGYDVVSIEQNQVKEYQAFPEWDIHPGVIDQDAKQKEEGFSCGYRAAYALFQNPNLRGETKLATEYAETPEHTEQLVESFCRIQLQGLQVEESVVRQLDRPVQQQFKINRSSPQDCHLTQHAISSAIDRIRAQVELLKAEGAQHPTVSQKLSKFSAADITQLFPGDILESQPLTVKDYRNYFSGLEDKLTRHRKVLKLMTLSPCDETTLDGLIAYCTENPDLKIEKLTIEIANSVDPERFRAKLQSSLMALSRSRVTSLSCIDKFEKLNEKHWENCAGFVEKHKVTVELMLPAVFQKGDLQRRIVKSISEHQQEKSAEAELAVIEKSKQAVAERQQQLKRVKQTRPKIDIEACKNVDIELQQEQQVEQQVEVAVELANTTFREMTRGDLAGSMSFQEFHDAVMNQTFKLPNRCYLLAEKDLKTIWNTWFGHIENAGLTSLHPRIAAVSAAACEQLLQYRDQFKLGIDYYHLPSGFVEQVDPLNITKRTLHYDKYQSRLENADPLAVRCLAPFTPDLWSYAQTESNFILLQGPLRDYAESLIKAEFDPIAFQLFRLHLAAILQLSAASQQLLWEACVIDGKFNTEQFDFILSNLETIAALFPKGYDENIKPASKFVTPAIVEIALSYQPAQKNSEMLMERLSGIVARPTPDVDTAFKILKSFGGSEAAIWWKALLMQHCDAVNADDLPSLVAAFQAFLVAVSNFGLSLYLPVHFSEVHNMRVAMARMLKILESTNPADRPAVWANITRLSFQSDAAIRAATAVEPKCGFVIPEMQCTPDHFHLNKIASQSKGYRTLFWHAYDEDWHKIENLDITILKMNFYRYIAHRATRLPLQFYQEALVHLEQRLTTIQDANLRSRIFRRLSSVLAAATTQPDQRGIEVSVEAAMRQWDQILTYLIEPSIPAIPRLPLMPTAESVKAEMQDFFSSTLFGFQSVPSFTEFIELFRAINEIVATIGVMNFKSQKARLKDILDKSKNILNVFGGEVLSSGRRFYPAGSVDLITYIELCWSIYQIDEERYKSGEQIKILGTPYKFASPEAQHFMRLISTFNLRSKQELIAIFRIWDELTTGDNKQYQNLMLDVLICLAELQSNVQKGDILHFKDLISVLQEAHAKIKVVPALNDPYAEREASQRARWETLGVWLLQRYGSALPQQRVSALLSTSLETQEVIKTIDSIFTDFTPATIQALKLLTGRYSTQLSEDKEHKFITRVKKILSECVPEQQVKLLNLLSLGQNFYQITQLLTLMAESPTSLVGDFFYLCGQKEAKTSPNLLNAAIIYLSNIVPSIEGLPGLSRFEALPIAASLLLLEHPETLGTSPSLNTPTVELWQEIVRNLRGFKAGTLTPVMLLKKMTILWERVSDPESFKSLQELISVVRQIAETESPKPESEGGLLSTFTGLFVTPQKAPPQAPVSLPRELLEAAIEEANKKLEEESKYPATFSELLRRISEIGEQYPIAKNDFLNFVSRFLSTPPEQGALIASCWSMLGIVQNCCFEIGDHEVIRSIFYWYSQKEKSPAELLALIKETPPGLTQKIIFTVISKLLDNDQTVSVEALRPLIGYITMALATDDKEFLTLIEEIYQKAPYPSLPTLLTWLENRNTLAETRVAYDLNPCLREDENGFDIVKAREQNDKCVGYQFSEAQLLGLDEAVKIYRKFSTTQLLEAFFQFSNKAKAAIPINNEMLAAVAAELLYRAKGTPGGGGKSFEINTTQYLAVLALLAGGEHVTAEIGTGEGKSRIMMIMNACQFALGKTVDFVTSDVVLSERDYHEYQSYFRLIGAKTSLIRANSPVDSYVKGGINFSDPANLSLFRNRARALGLGDLVIEMDPRLRALLLDEADKTYFDMADTRFNYSAEADESIRGMEWVYPLLIKFFTQTDVKKMHEDLFYNDVEACTAAFIDFARAYGASQNQMERLEMLSEEQIKTWQLSAMTALALRLGRDFNTKGDRLINTPEGPKIASEIKLIAHAREIAGAKFSYGTHQCLTAYLNRLKTLPPDPTLYEDDAKYQADKKLYDEISKYQHEFHMDPEKTIIYSSTPQGLLADYQVGTLKAVTGSMGANLEQHEAGVSYAHQGPVVDAEMKFIGIPRHSGLHRIDKPAILTESRLEQVQEILRAIVRGILDQQPILVICEDDRESEMLLDALQEAAKAYPLISSNATFQRIHSQLSAEDEKSMTGQAGKPGMITVSTRMIGRGTDIHLRTKEKNLVVDEFFVLEEEVGLKVLVTYLPSLRELLQIFGRSGRKGARGDAQLILDRTRMPAGYDPDTFPLELEIKRLQIIMDRKNQCERLIKYSAGAFRQQLTERYFATMKAEGTNRFWSNFTKDADQAWLELWPKINAELKALQPDLIKINAYLSRYHEKIATLWKELVGNIISEYGPRDLASDVAHLELSANTKKIINSFNLEESFAATLLEYMSRILQQGKGLIESMLLFQEFIEESHQHKQAVIKLALSHLQFPSHALLAAFTDSGEKNLLARMLDAYRNTPDATSDHAKFVVKFLKEQIQTTEWNVRALRGYTVEGCKTKLPNKIYQIYQQIIAAEQAENPDYSAVLASILEAGSRAITPKQAQVFQPEDVTKGFYKALREAHEKVVQVQELKHE